MTTLVFRRLLRTIPVLLLVSFATFYMTDLLPGGAAFSMLGETPTQEDIALVNAKYGFNDPFVERYVRWAGNALRLDFGDSFRTKESVLSSIKERLPVTAELALGAQFLAISVSITLALIGAARAGSRVDRFLTALMSSIVSTPGFLGALLLVYVFAIRLQWVPVTGWSYISDGLGDNLKSAALPMLTLALPEIASFQRVLRNDTLATLQEDYILAARAKGLRSRTIMVRHALRPSSFSLVTLAGLSLGRLLGGALIVESIFALPGLGQLVQQSVANRDIIMVQGVVMFIALVYVAMNFVVDMLYGFLDPRVRVRART